MKKKNNGILVGILIGLVISLIIVGGLFATNTIKLDEKEINSDSTDNNNTTIDNQVHKLNDNLKDTTLFAIKTPNDNRISKSLVAIDNKGEETIIYDFSKYSRDVDDIQYYYDKTSGIIYICIDSYEKNNHKDENEKWELATIDLTSNTNNYELKILTEIKVDRNNYDRMFADYITKVGNYIYFANRYLYKINLNDYKIEKIEDVEESQKRSINVLQYSDSILIYNVDTDIYRYNINNNTKEKIIENATIEYIYKNELIYVDVTDNKSIYYSYNLDTNNKKKVSEDVGGGRLGFSYTTPYNNTYLYLRGTSFYYDNKEIELSCNNIELDVCKYVDTTSYIIYSNTLLATAVSGIGPNDGPEDYRAFIVTIDLENQKVVNTTKLDESYSYLFVNYIK